MEMVFLKILNMSIAASWVVLAVLVLRFALKKSPKWINVALWALVAVRLVCPFSFESVLSLIPSTETVPEKIVYAAQPVLDTGVTVIDEIVNPVVTESLAPAGPMNSVNPVQVWLFIGGVLWVTGMGLMLLYGAVSYFRVRGKVRASIHLSDNIYLCDYIDTPFILGIVAPKIYLPSSMDPGAAAHVLSHERAHLKRRDHWWKPLGFVLLTIHWFNPLLWLAYILLCRDIEMACDEKVVREMDIPNKKAYSEALLRCSVSRRMTAACPLAFGEVGVKERVKTVLHYKKPAFWVVLIAVLALIAAAVCLLTDPVKDINGQRKFDLPGPNAADMDVQDIMTNIRKFTGLEKNENPYVNDYINDAILRGNFDLGLVHIPYFYDRDGKTYLSVAMFSDLAESCILSGQYEWEEQTSRFLFEHYLNALKYLPQERIQAMLPNTEYYRVRFVEEGTPGSYDRVIRYSDRGIGATDGWLIHLEVVPAYHENGGFHDTGEPSIHLFYGDEPADVNGVILDAKILEISNKSYLVEPMPGSQELSSTDRIRVQMELDTDPMPQVGDILRITYDGQLMETYPAQIGEVFGIRVVTGEYGIAQNLGKEIVHFNDKISLGIQIPEGWEYERVNTATDGSILEIRFRPAGEEGWVSLRYESAPFGVCGTGLTTENISFGSYEATQGFYDGRNIWSYISLHEELPGDYVILNDGADSWLHNADHHSLLWRMLETIAISEISQNGQAQEYVTYNKNYVNISVPKLEGWKYEITEWQSQVTGNMLSCGIKLRPEGEDGWIALRYYSDLQMALEGCDAPEQEISKESWPNYEVEISREPGSDSWLYIRYLLYEDDPKIFAGTHMAMNYGAVEWLQKETYYSQLMEILQNVRLAEGILLENEALAIARSAVENGDDLDYTVYRDRGEGNATGFTRVYLYDEGRDTFWNVKVDNEGNIRRINEEDHSRLYMYEKEGFGGNFIIKLSGDGVAMYYEGGLSSYIGLGTWKQEGDFVTVTVEQKPYRFCLEENALVFIAEGSSSFTYVEVADGERFILQEG